MLWQLRRSLLSHLPDAPLPAGIRLRPFVPGRDEPAWVGWTSLALAGPAIGLAALHTFPAAVRLGTGYDAPAARSALARSNCRDHLLCLGAIAALLAIQLTAAG